MGRLSPAGLGDEHDWRFSFCCAHDGCRTRKTPPSLRFLGRKVYLAAMVVLIAIMREGATAARMRQLSGLVGVDRRTVERWREWWRDTFTASPFWQIGRAAFMPPVDQDRLPASLIERFTGRGGSGSLRCCASSPRSPEATGTLDNGLPRSAENARRRQSRPRSTVCAP